MTANEARLMTETSRNEIVKHIDFQGLYTKVDNKIKQSALSGENDAYVRVEDDNYKVDNIMRHNICKHYEELGYCARFAKGGVMISW